MKQELTIAFCLLAAGVALGSWQSAGQLIGDTLGFGGDAVVPTVETRSDLLEQYSGDAIEPNDLASAVRQAAYVVPDSSSPAIPVTLGNPRPVSDFRSDGSTADRADLMLRRARHMIDDGPAFESSVVVRANFFGQTVVGSGGYLQAGRGEGKTRTSLAFHSISSGNTNGLPSTPPQQQITNLCDGRFVYRLHEDRIDDQQTLEFYDLQQIKNSKSNRAKQSSTGGDGIPLAPGELMASGMAGLLQHLADEFRFAIVEESNTATGSVRLLRGTWQPSRLQNLLRDHLTSEQLDAGLAWSQLPPNLPHAVEVTLVRTSAWELFPSQLTFYQFQNRNDRTMAQPIVTIQFQNPRAVDAVSADQFVLRSENLEATDLTQQYLSKLRPNDDSRLR